MEGFALLAFGSPFGALAPDEGSNPVTLWECRLCFLAKDRTKSAGSKTRYFYLLLLPRGIHGDSYRGKAWDAVRTTCIEEDPRLCKEEIKAMVEPVPLLFLPKRSDKGASSRRYTSPEGSTEA